MEQSLVPVCEDHDQVLMLHRSVVLLSKLMDELNGWAQITAVSGWRSEHEQEGIFTQSLKENGAAFTKQFVARPGHSEHQTGLAIDLGLKQPNIDFIRPDFPYFGICQLFREKATLYGFIERYPAGKEHITGIAHEPWHFRYVGTPHAAIMTELGLTLEEYLSFLKQFPHGSNAYLYQKSGICIAISYLEASKDGETCASLNADLPYSISGNNQDGFVITEWRRRNAG